MRVLVTGADGLLGTEAVTAFGGHRVFAAGHRRLDICSRESVKAELESFAPDWVVNCAAATDVDRCEIDRAWANALNFKAPQLLSELCADRGVALLHVSTDYVFDGETDTPYKETDAPQPINYYGETKLCGEQPVLEAGGIVVRTQWLYGQKKAGLIKRLLHQPQVKVIDDRTGCPTCARDVALVLVRLAESRCTGVFHVANSGAATWLDNAREIARLLPCRARIEPISADALDLAAKRPRFTALDCHKLAGVGIEPPRDWHGALAQFCREEGEML